MKKFILTALVLSLLFTIPLTVANAESNDITPYASELLSSYSIPIGVSADGVISATAKIATNYIVDELGFPVIRIEEKDGSEWVTMKSTTGRYREDSNKYTYKLTYQGKEGKQYRAYAEYRAKDGTLTDSRSKYSSTVTGK